MSLGTFSWQRPCCHPATQQRRWGLSHSGYGQHTLLVKLYMLTAPTFRRSLRYSNVIVRSIGEGATDAARGVVWIGASKDTSVSAQPRHGIPRIGVLSYKDNPDIGRAAVENMATAFADDPSTVYFCRPDQRVQFYRAVLSCALEWYPGERQLACTVPPEAAAIVYVYPRPRPAVSWFTQLRAGLGPLLCVRPGRLMAGLEASEYFEGLREEFLQAHGPFLYVSVIAVRPGRQGAGLGSALLAFLCDRADAAGLYTYIEATSLRNRALYERFGFQLIREWRANAEMPYTYVMCRLPNPQFTADPDSPPLLAPSTSSHLAATGTTAPDPAVNDIDRTPAAASSTTAAAASPSPSAPTTHASEPMQEPTSQLLKWQEAWRRRRRRFADWRRRRREEAQRQGNVEWSTAEAAVLPYVEVDEHDYWPLWSSSLAFDGKSVEEVVD